MPPSPSGGLVPAASNSPPCCTFATDVLRQFRQAAAPVHKGSGWLRRFAGSVALAPHPTSPFRAERSRGNKGSHRGPPLRSAPPKPFAGRKAAGDCSPILPDFPACIRRGKSSRPPPRSHRTAPKAPAVPIASGGNGEFAVPPAVLFRSGRRVRGAVFRG